MEKAPPQKKVREREGGEEMVQGQDRNLTRHAFPILELCRLP